MVTLNEAYQICREKVYFHMKKMNGALFEPTEQRDGNYYGERRGGKLAERYVWMPSFVSGMGVLLFQTDGNLEALKWANRFARQYHDKVFQDYSATMHDLGFLYLPYSVQLYQLTGDKGHRETALRAADELTKRFDVRGRYIEAWSEMNTRVEREGRMIVDSAMNVPLLFWAWKETGHSFYHDVATAHLETIMSILIREDYSVCHAYFFNLKTGEPYKEANSCGYANGSHWARGTAWLVFGLSIAYEYTGNEEYLDTAVKVAEKYLSSLDNGPVPVWDFRLPEEWPAKFCGNVMDYLTATWDESLPENRVYNVDTSAAAIMTCAFQVITRHRKLSTLSDYIKEALTVLSNEYLNTDVQIPGMVKRSDGRNVYTIFGDYYYMLALAVELFGIDTCWSGRQ